MQAFAVHSEQVTAHCSSSLSVHQSTHFSRQLHAAESGSHHVVDAVKVLLTCLHTAESTPQCNAEAGDMQLLKSSQ